MNARCGSTARRSKICKPRRFLRRFPNFRSNANAELYSMPQAPATHRMADAGRFYSFIQLIDLIEENPVMRIFSECAKMPSELVIGGLSPWIRLDAAPTDSIIASEFQAAATS